MLFKGDFPDDRTYQDPLKMKFLPLEKIKFLVDVVYAKFPIAKKQLEISAKSFDRRPFHGYVIQPYKAILHWVDQRGGLDCLEMLPAVNN